MRKDTNDYIDRCHTCAINKGNVGKPVPILSCPTSLEPRDALVIDMLKLPMTSEGHQYLLAAIDNFSGFSNQVLLKNKTAETVATALTDEAFLYIQHNQDLNLM